MSIRKLAQEFDIPFSTLQKYMTKLKEIGLINPRKEKHRVILSMHDRKILESIINYVKNGFSFNQAVQLVQDENKSLVEEIRELKRKIEQLEKENKALNELIQMYLSRIDEIQKALPKPRKSPWTWLKDLLSRFKIHRER